MSKEESELCRYSGYLCHRDKLKDYDYCLRHILEDKTAPFKQCTYNIKSQKRCLRPAPRADRKDGYCAEHARKALMNRHKLLAKKSHVELYSRCLEDLSHYQAVDPSEARREKNEEHETTEERKDLPPAKRIRLEEVEDGDVEAKELAFNANPYDLLAKVRSVSCVVEGGEELSENEEDVRVDQAWKGDGDSDAESVDSDLDNPLRHAGVYAAEEVVRIMRDKLIRLQKSYIDQFQRLQYLLREERRRYKQTVQKEKESLMSIHKQPKDTESERAAYRLIKSLNHYNLRQGKDAIFAAKVKEKRRRASEGSNAKEHGPKCTFNITSHIKCCEPTIPLSKFCLKHIFQDTSQVLFRRCGFITPADDEPCETPVPNTFDETTCVYHAYLPSLYSKHVTLEPELKEEEWLPTVKEEAPKPSLPQQDEVETEVIVPKTEEGVQGSPPSEKNTELISSPSHKLDSVEATAL